MFLTNEAEFQNFSFFLRYSVDLYLTFWHIAITTEIIILQLKSFLFFVIMLYVYVIYLFKYLLDFSKFYLHRSLFLSLSSSSSSELLMFSKKHYELRESVFTFNCNL